MIDVRHDAKKEGLVNKFKPAKKICEERLLNLQGVVPADSLPNLLNCVRQVNRGRESARPQAPAKDNPLFTIVLSGFPPDFYLGAVEVNIDVLMFYVDTCYLLRNFNLDISLILNFGWVMGLRASF